MNYTGYHVILDIFGCSYQQLEDVSFMIKIMEGLIKKMCTNILVQTYHKFEPQGLSLVFIISASHITVHTWPENGYVGIDIFTCSEDFDKEMVERYFKQSLKCKNIVSHKMYRGVIDVNNNFCNPIYY